jgi:serine/threonine protein kinase
VAFPVTSTIGGGRYALCGEIASGGMATVHLARQLGAAGFARIVAVKRLHERYARDPELVAMFLDEARIVARIDVVAEDGELFLVLEYVHGESLLRVMRVANKNGTPLPIPVVAAALAGALHGLHEAHDARSETGEPLGIVHRDVSPHNVLVGTDGVSRVLDFGVAKATERIQTTLEGQLKGKLSYMAPEQLTNGPPNRPSRRRARRARCRASCPTASVFAARRRSDQRGSSRVIASHRESSRVIASHPTRSCFAMTMRCTSLVPSPISQIFASRRWRSTANSRV